MTTLRFKLVVSLLAVGTAGCASAVAPERAVSPSAVTTATTAPPTSATDEPSPSATETIPTIGSEQALEAGTYRLSSAAVGTAFPPILMTVPDGWFGDGPFVYLPQPGRANVAVQFWNVDQVYGHPCQWSGTLSDPGPTVDDLVAALVEVPRRDATAPIDVTIGGIPGKYLEWTVPSDIEMDDDGNFLDCDRDGEHADFKSWTGSGIATNRYHQGPGQVDRLWILDLDGARLVIDAFSMPSTSTEDQKQLLEVVASIRFER